MANGKYEAKEWRFIFEKELTQVYVLLEADANCPIGVQGWHHKTFPASMSVVDILKKEAVDSVMWPQDAPPSR